MTTETHFEVLTKRMERLERENRRWKMGAIAVLLAATMALVMGQAMPERKAVEATRFVLVDNAGKVRSDWNVDDEGYARLACYGQDGGTRAELGVDADGWARLAFYVREEEGEEGEPLLPVSLGIDPDGNPLFLLSLGVAGAMKESGRRAKEEMLLQLLNELNNATVLYRNDVGRYPQRLEDLVLPEGAGPRGYQGPYIYPPIPNDPVTGKPFVYDPETGFVTAPD